MSEVEQKRRRNSAEMTTWRQELVKLLRDNQPMTLRQIFYRCVGLGLVEKTENAYTALSWEFARMRENGIVDDDWIVDYTRHINEPLMYDSPKDALRSLAGYYREDPWKDMNTQVQVWVEKEALSGIFESVTRQMRVPLIAVKGFSSRSLLVKMARHALGRGKPLYVAQFGDWDPSGVLARSEIRDRFLDVIDGALKVKFTDVAVLKRQIDRFRLPTRPSKTSHSHAKGWTGGDSVELDTFTTPQLQGFVRDFINQYIDKAVFEETVEREERVRVKLRRLKVD